MARFNLMALANRRVLHSQLAFLGLLAYSSSLHALDWLDPSPHKVQIVGVAQGVNIEVLDWGGSGRAIVLIAGSGGTAHVYDDFALKLTPYFHVFGVTRRGYGVSSAPRIGYDADRLGDDLVSVMKALKIDKPILAGHSFGGQEVSDVSTRFPNLISGAIYFDAVYSYDAKFDDEALYWSVEWKKQIKLLEKHLNELLEAPNNPKAVAVELRDKDLPAVLNLASTLIRVENGRRGWVDPLPADLADFSSVREWYHRCFNVYLPESEFRQMLVATPDGRPTMQYRAPDRVSEALLKGRKAFHHILVPALYIGAAENDPGIFDKNDPEARSNSEAYVAYQNGWIARRTARFLEDAPNGRLVIEQHASHFVFLSNEDDVLLEILAFAASLMPVS